MNSKSQLASSTKQSASLAIQIIMSTLFSFPRTETIDHVSDPNQLTAFSSKTRISERHTALPSYSFSWPGHLWKGGMPAWPTQLQHTHTPSGRIGTENHTKDSHLKKERVGNSRPIPILGNSLAETVGISSSVKFPGIACWTYLGLLSSKNSFSGCIRWPLVSPAGNSFLSIILHHCILDDYWYTFLLMPVWSLRGIFVGQAHLSLVIKCPQKLNRFLFCLRTTRFMLK